MVTSSKDCSLWATDRPLHLTSLCDGTYPAVFNDVTGVALHSAMNGLAARQRVIADNVANIQTPGFLAGRVQFEDALRSAVDSGSGSVAHTTARSLEPTRLDGNNVNLDREVLSNIDTGLRYQLVVKAVDDRFSLLRASLRTQS